MKIPCAVREAGTFDAEGIARVDIESSQVSFAPLARHWPPPDLAARAAWWASLLEASLADSKRVDFVATVDDLVVGFVGGGPARRSDVPARVEIYVIHVLPDNRGNGIGGQLWNVACGLLRGTSRAPLYVETLAELRCCSFYETHGGEVLTRNPSTLHGGVVTQLVYIWPEGTSNEPRPAT